MATILTIDQFAEVSVIYKDRLGNAARVDGVPAWSSSNEAALSLVVAEDGFSARAVSGDAIGTAQAVIRADADMGEGIREVITIVDFETVAGDAVAGEASVGEAQPKEAAPAPEPTA